MSLSPSFFFLKSHGTNSCRWAAISRTIVDDLIVSADGPSRQKIMSPHLCASLLHFFSRDIKRCKELFQIMDDFSSYPQTETGAQGGDAKRASSRRVDLFNGFCYTRLFQACAGSGDLQFGRVVHQHLNQRRSSVTGMLTPT